MWCGPDLDAVRALFLFPLLLLPPTLGAQARPDLDWRTITTPRFRVHFTPELEELARRTAASADSAYARLARELPPPRGLIEIIVTDHLDWANGAATPFPTNRIYVHARPPVDELSLRDHEDWNLALVTHEMTHIFQLDRADGWWRLARRVFGRAAPFFPNSYVPSWLVEGVAVHYETRFTRGGRLAGSEFPAHARALALGDALPPIDGLALPRPFFPGGNSAYQFGAFLVRRTVEHEGALNADTAAAMSRLIDRMSARINPWRLDASAREAVGATFSSIYASWRDSVRRAVAAGEARAAGEANVADAANVVTLVAPAWTARFPRFLSSGEILYVADDRRRSPALHRIGVDGRVRRLDRRNSVDANAPLADGRVIRGELEATGPYSVQGDLFVGEGLARRRLSRRARLAHPDVHAASGRIVAVRTVAGTTELVTLSVDDPTPRLLAIGSFDTTWSEPRWSHDGSRIAAALWERGGRTSIVVLDASGGETRRFSPRAANDDRLVIVSAPAWFPGDTLLAFVSDHEGAPMIYRGDVRTGAYRRLWSTRTALNTPDVSHDGAQLVAVELRANGWAVVRREIGHLEPLGDAPPARDLIALPPLGAVVLDDRPVPQRFDARLTMEPSWWLPSVTVSDDNTTVIGGFTSSRDVIGRHAWGLAVARDLGHPEFTVRAGYSYAGLRNPTLSFSAANEWAHGAVTSGGERIGTLAQRAVTFGTSAILSRPRVRNFTYAVLSGEVEYQSFRTYPAELLARFSAPELLRVTALPRLTGAIGFSTMQRPGLSVSVEDGLAVDAYYRHRIRDGIADASIGEAVVRGSVAKSLPLPGFARHAIAARAALGVTDNSARSGFAVGGISGSTIELLPGLSYGDPQRTFFVRGFDPSAQQGVRAAAASAEYRMPLARVGRGVALAPVFLQKLSLLAFADAGAAWCERQVTDSRLCGGPVVPRRWVASAGGELIFDAAVHYDVLYRFRLGFARPVRGAEASTRNGTFYFTLGNTF